MKKTIKVLSSVVTASIILLTSVGSVFADREMIIPGLPQVEYRNG
ncbi:N-acetylmuramoyl-L-alanine amidase, partial [Bacillus cereus]|nr:N-acetylmuramoyl-L-alanine amidase [Bacillus cereus]